MKSLMKYISFVSLGVLVLLFIIATVVEKFYGTLFVVEYIYTSPSIIFIWLLLVASGIIYLVLSGIYKKIPTFLMHISFVVILIGALVTHFFCINGYVRLRVGGTPTTVYMLKDGNYGRFPFALSLQEFSVPCYPGTDSPMDYVSNIYITDADEEYYATVSMNNVYSHKWWRFCQSEYDDDKKGATLLVSYDPWGLGITYTGYCMLFFSFVAFFFERRSGFRALLNRVHSLGRGVMPMLAVIFILLPQSAVAQNENMASDVSYASFSIQSLYDVVCNVRPLSIVSVVLGTVSFFFCCIATCSNRLLRYIRILLSIISVVVVAYVLLLMLLRGYIGGYMPLSNGFETMLFMALSVLLVGVAVQRRFFLAAPLSLLVAGFALLVAGMGDATRITPLVPVLQSPLLSIHVAVIMVSYSLFTFVMLNGVAALFLFIKGDRQEQIEFMAVITRLLLYPALFLLVIGVFVGAVWANISWGRYWGWDPKEVWALITMMVYSLPLHSRSFVCFNRPIFLHIFSIVAFLTVLATYFGVNFILGGLHGYI